jgi:hypothetical protein
MKEGRFDGPAAGGFYPIFPAERQNFSGSAKACDVSEP